MHSSLVLTTLLSVACAANAATTIVKVGANGTLRYDPEQLSGLVNEDVVVFQFQAKNHTATQSNFATPCQPLAGGHQSGFEPVNANATATGEALPEFTVTVQNASAPMWFYCSQTVPVSHCEAGMVFAINAPTTGKTFAAFQAAAMALNSTANSTSTADSTSTAAESSASGIYGPSSESADSVTSATPAGSVASGTSTSSAATASTTGDTSAAMKVSGSAAGALTVVTLLVGLAL